MRLSISVRGSDSIVTAFLARKLKLQTPNHKCFIPNRKRLIRKQTTRTPLRKRTSIKNPRIDDRRQIAIIRNRTNRGNGEEEPRPNQSRNNRAKPSGQRGDGGLSEHFAKPGWREQNVGK